MIQLSNIVTNTKKGEFDSMSVYITSFCIYGYHEMNIFPQVTSTSYTCYLLFTHSVPCRIMFVLYSPPLEGGCKEVQGVYNTFAKLNKIIKVSNR